VSEERQTPAGPAAPSRRRLALHWQILIGLVIGAALGASAELVFPPDEAGRTHERLAWIIENLARPLGQIFLRLIFMVVVPLVFSALVLGVAGMGDLRRLGRVGLLSLAFTVGFSAISVAIALTLVIVVEPGKGLTEEQRSELWARHAGEAELRIAEARERRTVRDALLEIIPRNPLAEMVGAIDGGAGGGMLAVMFFALCFGVALTTIGAQAQPVLGFLEGLFAACMAIIGFAMRLAPFGVGGLMFALVADLGADVLRILLWFMLTSLAGLALHMFGVYSLVLVTLARMNPLRFFARISEAILTAFGTSSSNATLPTALRVAEQRLGLRREVSNFVLTVGATANQNGTALYEGVTVLFLAQVFGVPLSLSDQLFVALMCVLGGIGTAGVPGGSLPYIAIILQSVGVPAEGIGVIAGIDRLLDMCRTTVNVTGDIAIAACVDRLSGPSPLPAAREVLANPAHRR
jgi:DAACS family dicarboxylate/amino acid:cation (Na+ or H+) symporter